MGARKSLEHSRTRNSRRGFRSRTQEIWCARGALQSARGALRNRVETVKGLRVKAEILRAPEYSLTPRDPVEAVRMTTIFLLHEAPDVQIIGPSV
ncbi:hypothetical protein RSOLAG1IB_12249 [Rhizoctonia solani AG-1 IB]|uniref:Uncharacterized protein n=1 Tax=Thanatephorus cucumeris (strain AG1-IB / isolate 7/3/14) TaxID=1108050 RepID=A0A0B7FS88_THACB|nr:hypothetical protein RSOLAG1IB_12249 [Rhizoctonia solani AG-1 IB]